MNVHHTGRTAALCSFVLAFGVAACTEVLAQQPQQEDQTLEEITVTGSRIVRRDYEAQTPIVTVDARGSESQVHQRVMDAIARLPERR